MLSTMLATILTTTSLGAGWVWTKETGWYNPARAVQSTPEELFKQAGNAFESKNYPDAARGYRLLLEFYPDSPQSAPAYGQLLEAQFFSKQFDEALTTIDEILARGPDAETISHVVRRKYEIGAAFLTGTPRRFMGFPVSAERYAVEVLTSLVERFPYQRYSDDALFHIASYYIGKADFQKAELVYQRLIRDYPQSEWAGIAEYQIGLAALLRLKGVEYDFAPVDEAERRFGGYLRRYPRGDKAREARRGLETINRLRAERLLGIATFYLREEKPRAARQHLRRILEDHPDAPVAGRARELLKSALGPKP